MIALALALAATQAFDPTPVITGIVTGLGGIGAGITGGYFLLRGKRVEVQSEETRAEITATSAFLEGQKAFQEYVDGVVEERVAAAVAGMQSELDDLKRDLADMRTAAHEMNDAYRSYSTRLWIWNVKDNRAYEMPELPLEVLRKLGISHLSSAGDVDVDEDTEPIHPKEKDTP